MNILVLDTETGDLTHDKTALTAIGAVALRLEAGKLLPLEGDAKPRELELLIQPDPSLRLTDRALEVQGLTRNALRADPCRVSETLALSQLYHWLVGAGFYASGPWPIWAHNAEFDRNHLGEAIRRSYKSLERLCGRDSTWACTRYMAQNLVALGYMERPTGDGGKIKPGFTLDALCYHFGISVASREAGHGALSDAKLCARILAKLAAVQALTSNNPVSGNTRHAPAGTLGADSGDSSPLGGVLGHPGAPEAANSGTEATR